MIDPRFDLPTPSLSATITPPTRKGGLGTVVIAGYTPPPAYERDAPRTCAARKPAICAICDLPGHIRSNSRFHPRST